MEKHAANDGDKLKHSLLLEVLARCTGWPALNYAETHAGAGYYLASQQAKSEHIAKLRQIVQHPKRVPEAGEPGQLYYSLLKEWWSNSDNHDHYPGSVLQTALFLKQHQVTSGFRVVEATDRTYDRLYASVSTYGVIPRHGKFQHHIQWLSEPDSLVLLIDPFSFSQNYGEQADKQLNKGGIDLPRLEALLDQCRRKSSAVIVFWCSFSHEHGPQQKRIAIQWMKRFSDEVGGNLRGFYRGIYHTLVLGIGDGKCVVESLSQKEAWQESWPVAITEFVI
jgi:23S rRNA A2030 N6-methylase RlmJ